MSKRVKQLEDQLSIQSKNFATVLADLGAANAELEALRASKGTDMEAALQQHMEAERRADALAASVTELEARLISLTDKHQAEAHEMAQVIAKLQQQWATKKEQCLRLSTAVRQSLSPAHTSLADVRTPPSE